MVLVLKIISTVTLDYLHLLKMEDRKQNFNEDCLYATPDNLSALTLTFTNLHVKRVKNSSMHLLGSGECQ